MATGQIVLMTGLCLAAFVAVAIELRWRVRMDLIDQYQAKGTGLPLPLLLTATGGSPPKWDCSKTEAIRRDLSGLFLP
jgi:hypothetical protein